MFESLFGKRVSGLTLLLDIGSGSVGAALIRENQKGLPKILFAIREPIKLQRRPHPEHLFSQMTKALERVLEIVQKQGIVRAHADKEAPRTVGDVFVALNSPWFLSETKSLSLSSIKPLLVTRELIDNLITREEESFEKYKDGSPRQTFRIERQITNIQLNGYETPEPYGKRASDIKVSIYLSFTEKFVMENVRRAVRARFSPKRLSFFSVPFAAYSAISKRFSPDRDFVLVDVGREISDISLIKKGELIEMYSFPIGKNYLIRHLAEAEDLDPDAARSSLVLSLGDKVDAAHREKIKKMIEHVREVWLGRFHDASVALSANHYLPNDFYLLSQKDFAPFFADTLGRADTSEFSPGKGAPRVHFLGQDELKNVAEYAEGVDGDPFLTIETAHVGSLLNPSYTR